MLFWVWMDGVSWDFLESVGDEVLGIVEDSFDVFVSLAFSFPFPLSTLKVRLSIAVKAGAEGAVKILAVGFRPLLFEPGMRGLWDEGGRVPITPIGGGLDCPAKVSDGKNSSSSLAIPLANAVVEPC